jgi:hypothetical protein
MKEAHGKENVTTSGKPAGLGKPSRQGTCCSGADRIVQTIPPATLGGWIFIAETVTLGDEAMEKERHHYSCS